MDPITREIMAFSALEVFRSGSEQKLIPSSDKTSHPLELILYGPEASLSVVFLPKIKILLIACSHQLTFY